MTYTKFTVAAQGAEKKPSYVKGERRIKGVRSVFSASIPDSVKAQRSDENIETRVDTPFRELEYIFSDEEREEDSLPARTNVSLKLMSGFAVVFFAFVSVLGVYVCGINAPEFIESALVDSCDYLGEKYEKLFFRENRDFVADAKEYEYNESDIPGQSSDMMSDDENVYGYVEGSFIASTVLSQSEAEKDSGNEVLSSVGAFSDVQDEGDAVIVSKNFSRGSDKVYALNETSLNLDTEALSLATYPIEAYSGTSEPVVLIVHTHGTECYADSTADGSVRTVDTSKNVVRAGQELATLLNSYGIPTLHSKTMHDEISYITSYQNSRAEVKELLAAHPTIKYVIDLHRDGIPDDNGARVKPIAQINGESAAQLMLVMGTSAGGGNHPNYLQNLTVASHVQKRLNSLYPGLMRSINLRGAVFNQNLCPGYLLLEVGSDANTLSEALAAIRMFARGFAETVLRGE